MIFVLIVLFAAVLLLGLYTLVVSLRDADHWLHRRFNPQKKYADEGLSTEMADPEELEEITHGTDPIPNKIVE